MPEVVLVTLSYDNVEEARKTMASVALQNVSPSRFVIVDSSSPAKASEIRQLAQLANAEYHWVEPQGVYVAMNFALSLLKDDDFVWFINSSDWLADLDSVANMTKALREGAQWVVGGLRRLGDHTFPFHPIPADPSQFVQELQAGSIGFPHPSTIMSVKGIRDIGGFDSRFRIAADYDLALRFSVTSPSPVIVKDVVSVHVPTGLTSRFKLRHLLEKKKARQNLFGSSGRLSRESKIVFRMVYQRTRRRLIGSQARVKHDLRSTFDQQLDRWPGIGV